MIDIIIPVYNAHNTLKQTLISVALQSIKDKFCVYIVDDCSDESYDEIVNLFKDKLNIRQIRLPKNSGPGVSRQIGLDNSNNEYIMFIDGDDLFIDRFSVENVYKNIVDSDIELAVGVMVDETKDGYFDHPNHIGCLHGKMYRRSFLKKCNIKFNECRNCEDYAFHNLVLLANPKTIYVNYYTYLYRYNSCSITQSDLNYEFNEFEWYVYNNVWVIKNAEERNFNEKLIAELVLSATTYLWAFYIKRIGHKQSEAILQWSKPLMEYSKKYAYLFDQVKARETC